jgi:hypothetical protein
MATVSITEILGSDNIAGSRVTINSNFSILATAINKIETNVDTSFTPGGKLTVGSSLIKKYTNPVTSQIFTCEASGLFSGNLTVSKILTVTESSSIGTDLTVAGNVTFDNSASGTGSFVCNLPLEIDAPIVSPQLDGQSGSDAMFVNPQDLAQSPSATVRGLSGLTGVSVIRLDFSTYASGTTSLSCNTIQFPSASSYPGQVVTVIIDEPAAAAGATFSISPTNLATGLTTIRLNNGLLSDSNNLRRSAVTLYADTQVGGGWRMLSSTPYVSFA